MPLLIDCYNLLHTPMPQVLAGLDERELCRVLGRSVFAGDRIVVVCDGVVKPGGPQRSPVAGVKLVYSGPKRSADSVIIGLIGKDSAPRRLIVVSDDRQIQVAARRRRARPMPCAELIAVLTTPRQSAEPGRPLPELSRDEVESWLEEFGVEE